MALCPDIRLVERRLIHRPRLEIAVARRAALDGAGLGRPQRDEADRVASRVGVGGVEGEVTRDGGRVRGAGVHARVEVGCEEGHERCVWRVLVAEHGEGHLVEDFEATNSQQPRRGVDYQAARPK